LVQGFRNFLLRGDVVVIAIGLVVALAFSMLVVSFTSNILKPIINRIEGRHPVGLGVQLGAKGNPTTFVNFGAFISDIIYFILYMAIIYFLIVVPYKHISARRGAVVFGTPGPVKTCPACLSDDLPAAATKCKYCGTEMAASAA
jgi:large conductance mechanosensitive channel